MIGYIQRNIKKLSIVLWIIVAAFVGTIFLVWGRGAFMGMGGNYIAKVGDVEIPIQDFERTYSKIVDFYMRLYKGKLTPAMIKKMGVKEQALGILINKALIVNTAREEGFTVSPMEIAEALASVKAFQVNGRFDPKRYKDVLRANGYTPVEFERQLYNDILSKKLEATVKASADVLPVEAELFARRMLQKAKITYFVADLKDFIPMTQITEGEAKDFYKKHAEMFRTEPQLALEYVLIKPEDFKKGIKVTQEDIERYYKENPDQFVTKNGTIKPLAEVKQEIIKTIEKNRARKEALKFALKLERQMQKSTMEAVCKKNHVPIKRIPLLPVSKIDLPKAVIDKALKLPEDKPSEVIRTEKGFYIVLVDRKIPSRIPSFEEVRLDVIRVLQKKKAPETAESWAKKLLEAKGNLKEIVKKKGLKYKVKESKPFTRSGLVVEKEVFRQVAGKAFQLEPGQKGYVVENGKLVVFQLEKIIEPKEDELKEKAKQLEPLIVANKREKVWSRFLKEIRERTEIRLNQKVWEAIR